MQNKGDETVDNKSKFLNSAEQMAEKLGPNGNRSACTCLQDSTTPATIRHCTRYPWRILPQIQDPCTIHRTRKRNVY
jgi:hypothetical protein